jgi:hypothetical protein
MMAVKISPGAIQNLQQIEAVVAGPDDANRLLIIDGQFDSGHFSRRCHYFDVFPE